MIVEKENITEYVPQRGVMVMVDCIVSVDEKKTVTKLEIRPDNLFLENGVFSESGMVENMAQTAAAGAGYRYINSGKPVPIGFIASVKGLEVKGCAEELSTITTTCEIQDDIMGVTIVDACVNLGETEIASCQLRIFLKEEPNN